VQCAKLKRLLVCMQCRFCRRAATSLPKIDASFHCILCRAIQPACVQLGHFQSCVLALAQSSVHVMNNMSALEEALDILPFTVDSKAVKEAVINQVAQELCTNLRQRESSFNVTEDAMKQALASALIETQRKVVSNPPAFVSIFKKYGAQVLWGRQTACPMAVCLTVPLVQVHQAELQAQKSAVQPCRAQARQCQLEAWALQTSWIPMC